MSWFDQDLDKEKEEELEALKLEFEILFSGLKKAKRAMEGQISTADLNTLNYYLGEVEEIVGDSDTAEARVKDVYEGRIPFDGDRREKVKEFIADLKPVETKVYKTIGTKEITDSKTGEIKIETIDQTCIPGVFEDELIDKKKDDGITVE